MDVVVKGRNLEVPDHFRQFVTEKMQKVERYDQKLFEVDVELSHERNRRQSERCQRVEITCRSRGPAVRAEACAKDFYTAVDAALAKLEGRLRKVADRRRVHRGRRTPVSVASATAPLVDEAAMAVDQGSVAVLNRPADTDVEPMMEEGPGRIVREKEHPADPMTVDDALFQMELVGHDFYMFMDKESGRPSVVYRRKGFDYGILRLAM
ncbi:ribosome hibernation-promoting factor, HPF/YfiA family [Actinocatenispora rupis]|uniref:Ribosome hibernation promoting factor n=1 Tax=Actinocatenispora rupis TaxID=519421 RepID=A0A8J3J5T7_9ACTN|nr:ribosome-associated translation inhibitor RaiA [Actinocatenispora rupis]GID10644.1 ribosomal subunit interface protein [Actinocatenispora rupis]